MFSIQAQSMPTKFIALGETTSFARKTASDCPGLPWDGHLQILKSEKPHTKQVRQDELDRIPIEGKFGQGKRRFCLSKIMSKLYCRS